MLAKEAFMTGEVKESGGVEGSGTSLKWGK